MAATGPTQATGRSPWNLCATMTDGGLRGRPRLSDPRQRRTVRASAHSRRSATSTKTRACARSCSASAWSTKPLRRSGPSSWSSKWFKSATEPKRPEATITTSRAQARALSSHRTPSHRQRRVRAVPFWSTPESKLGIVSSRARSTEEQVRDGSTIQPKPRVQTNRRPLHLRSQSLVQGEPNR